MKCIKYILLIFLLACVSKAPNSPDRTEVFKNFPVNSNLRCVGLSLIVETLLENKYTDDDTKADANQFSDIIYRKQFEDAKVKIPQTIKIDGTELPINSHKAMNHLGTLITDIYKKEFYRIYKTEEGKKRIDSQNKLYLKNLKELTDILNPDPDKLEVFFGTGKRTFDDGTIKTTLHAFILGIDKNGEIIVRDPNDPREFWKCKVDKTKEGLTVGWRCKYRDTGHVTSQTYHIVST